MDCCVDWRSCPVIRHDDTQSYWSSGQPGSLASNHGLQRRDIVRGEGQIRSQGDRKDHSQAANRKPFLENRR